MKLYVYDHCPYCVKARMIFGLKHIPFELVTLLNDDEATPIRMIGAKMVPILEKDDGSYMPESMDIVHYIDQQFGNHPMISYIESSAELTRWKEQIRQIMYPLCMPRWVKVGLEEFATPSAIAYFTHKKEAMIGKFEEHLANSANLIAQANQLLQALEPQIALPNAIYGELSEEDIHLFAILRSLSVVKGLQYPAKVESYRKTMASLSHIPLHDAVAV